MGDTRLSTSAAFLARQLENTVRGPMWHGDALGALLDDITADEANARPIPGAHTIAELVAHLSAWVDICRRRLHGETGDPATTEDWPSVDASTEERWRRSVWQLGERYASIAHATSALSPEQLDADLPGRSYSAAVMLNGLVAHGAYHGGQIALLKKALRVRK